MRGVILQHRIRQHSARCTARLSLSLLLAFFPAAGFTAHPTSCHSGSGNITSNVGEESCAARSRRCRRYAAAAALARSAQPAECACFRGAGVRSRSQGIQPFRNYVGFAGRCATTASIPASDPGNGPRSRKRRSATICVIPEADVTAASNPAATAAATTTSTRFRGTSCSGVDGSDSGSRCGSVSSNGCGAVDAHRGLSGLGSTCDWWCWGEGMMHEYHVTSPI